MRKIVLTTLLLSMLPVLCLATYSENFDSQLGWVPFQGPKSKVTLNVINKDIKEGKSAVQVSFDVQDWGGVGKTFLPKSKFSKTGTLEINVKNASVVANKLRIEIADNGSQRFEYLIPLNFTGWKLFTIPMTSFKHRSDWQPAGAPTTPLALTSVEGISFSPVASGKAIVTLDGLSVK